MRTSRLTGRRESENEIEVTPEMVEVGVPHLFGYHPEHGVNAEETVKRIFQAMDLCRARVGIEPVHTAAMFCQD